VISTISEETRPEKQSETRPTRHLQVMNDDYPWYSTYYTIADADENIGQLYKKLSRSLEKLQQRPPPTTVQFQPEQHEKVTTPNYDRQALADTKDTREKVHELAQLSTKLTTTSTIEQENDDGFQVEQQLSHVPSSTTKSAASPDIDLTSVVLHGHADASIILPSNVAQTTTTTTTISTKKKHKKQKKDKPETVRSQVSEERLETIESSLLLSSTTSDSLQTDQTSEEIKHELDQLHQTTDEFNQKLIDERNDKHQAQPLSTSSISEIQARKTKGDEKNESTSSDASQWSPTSFRTFPEDNKTDAQTTEQIIPSEPTLIIPSTDHESIQPELLPSSLSTKKKKIKQQLVDKETSQQSKIPSSSLALEESSVRSKPAPQTSTQTTTKAVPTKRVTLPQEEEEADDDDGFQVVRYRKRLLSTTGPEKTPPSSSSTTTIASQQRATSEIDLKSAIIQRRQGPWSPAFKQTTPTSQKHKTNMKKTTSLDASLSSPSTDADIISSSSIDSHRAKHIEQKPAEQQKKTVDTTQPKSLFSTLLTSNTGPPLITQQTAKQQPKDEETILQSQIPSLLSLTVEKSKVKSKPISPPQSKTTTKVTLRTKAATSPEEEDEDNEGFQVVRYRKSVPSAARSEKTLPPLPTKTPYKQTLSRSIDLKPVVIRGRHGSGPESGTRSTPRTTPSGQIPFDKRQQIRSKQDRQQIPLFNAPSLPTSKETHIRSSSGVETRRIEPTKQPVKERPQRISDTTLLSSFIEPKWKPIEQQQTANIESQGTSPVVQSKSSDQNQKQEKIKTKTSLSSEHISSTGDRSIEPLVKEYHVPTKDEVKTVVQQSSIKETVPSAIINPTTTEIQKSPLTEDEDEDDGFRIVRYRKHTPSSTPTTTPTIAKQFSFGSDTDKRPVQVPKKQLSSPSTTSPSPTILQIMPSKTKPNKLKKNKEEPIVSVIPQSVEIVSSSNTDTDLVSSSNEEFTNRRTIEHNKQVPKSQITSDDISSPDLEKALTNIPTTHETINTEVTEPVQSTDLTEPVHKLLTDSHHEIQSTTSPTVTSEESSKKSKKQQKREPDDSKMSSPSDEISGTVDNRITTQLITPSSPSEAPVTAIPSSSVKVDEKPEKITPKEESLSSPSIESTANIEDEQVKTTTSNKKTTKRRKKKSHTTDKQDAEESLLNSSTTNAADKDSSSSTPDKHTSLESTTMNRSISEDDKQESEWITSQNKNQQSKLIEPIITSQSNEQKLAYDLPSSPQPMVSKIVPEKVTDVQFKFKKDGELTMTSQSSLERSPTEWGTVKFTSEQEDLLQQDKIVSSTEQSTAQQLIPKEEPTIEQTTNLTPKIDNETNSGTPTKSIESSETGGEADLDAYRDHTGRLRRKKPRKHTKSLSKYEDTPPVLSQPTSEDNTLHRKNISDHWADVLATPLSNTDDEQKLSLELVREDQTYEDEDTSKRNSKLDTFLPEYIRQQIRTSSSARSSSLNDNRSKSSSVELSSSIIHSRLTHIFSPPLSNQSTSTDTSENEGQKQLQKSLDKKLEHSNFISTTKQTENNTSLTSSSSSPTDTIRKKKQRPKMLKKDIEAKTLLTHEFDDTPLITTEIQQTSPVIKTEENEIKNELFVSSIRQQFDSVISTISDSFASVLSSSREAPTDEQDIHQSDEPIILSYKTSLESTSTVTKKSSTRSPRKRSKRDSGPDYENLIVQPSIDIEQSFSSMRIITTENDQTDFIKVETHKQRTSSGRQTSDTEDENEQQAVLADDEEDDVAPRFGPSTLPGTTNGATIQTSHKTNTRIEDTEFPSYIEPDVLKPETDETTSDQQIATTANAQLRVVQGFHSYTPNKYQYNQYEEGPTTSSELSKSATTETEGSDAILSRGFNLWLQQGEEIKSTTSSNKEEPSSIGSGLTRAMQSLIIQPVETDNDEDDEEEDSWNGPRAKKPTYTTGIRPEKRIHTTSAYNINHPRSTIITPSWLISQSNDDDPSKFDPDEEDSLDDTSEKQPISPPINTQISTIEERQTHINNLAELTFQPSISNLSSPSSSTVKWNETPTRNDDTNQLQTNFTEDDVQRCLGEHFYRESLAVNTLPNEQRTITRLDDLVLKPLQLSEEIDDEDDNNDDDNQTNTNNNNNNCSINFDEWAHFLERQKDQHVLLRSVPSSSIIEQDISPTNECSYAQVLDEDTLISDKDRSHLTEHVQYSFETERQRYGDFSPLNDVSLESETTIDRSLLSSTSEQHLTSQQKPSETFQKWRNQSSQNQEELNSDLSNLTSSETQNDDEIFVSHSDGGLSRRVRPST
jgi:hypothetical protein